MTTDTTPRAIDFWFDFSCPYAYLASTQIEAVAERTGATLHPKPMLLGGVFRAVGQSQKLFETYSGAKNAHMAADLRRWAALWDVPLKFPTGHPLRTVTALRSMLVVGEPFMPLAHAFFRAYWVDGIDLSTDEGVAAVLIAQGHDAQAVLEAARDQTVKDDLRARTDEALAAGVFGAPATVVDGALHWGQDRLDVVERLLGGDPAPLNADVEGPLPATDFWFDYSSPFASIAALRVASVFGDSVRFKPMLLGGVFHALGGPIVPLETFSPSKRRWSATDMVRQAADAGLDFKWPSRFPMRTMLPLRVTLLAGPDTPGGRALTARLVRAYWEEDRDISSPEVVAACCDDVGLDGAALVEGTSAPEIKLALRTNTEAAVEAGVFGAPTTVVHHQDGDTSLYWGNDRLEMAARAAAGDTTLR